MPVNPGSNILAVVLSHHTSNRLLLLLLLYPGSNGYVEFVFWHTLACRDDISTPNSALNAPCYNGLVTIGLASTLSMLLPSDKTTFKIPSMPTAPPPPPTSKTACYFRCTSASTSTRSPQGSSTSFMGRAVPILGTTHAWYGVLSW